MQTEKQKIGELGENIACKFLMKHGHEILDRNYRKKWGEIDVVARKDNMLHFIEVKTVSRETEHMPEENVHPWKRKRLARAIQTYLLEKESETEWQIDIMAVFLDFNSKKAKIRITKNVIL
ncbi:YraN family protein [Candidatus Parcubacteria bacterium]|nr:YraN family protein [Patescibacteria group bacterium]MBU4477400.1 YraN family protein [Patescibacteria group bacterium]MCG2698880.1 YraN family protein [Candidatus Parcubacteria bacterium]